MFKEELGDGHVGGNVWGGAIGRDEFLDNWLRRHNIVG